MGQDEDAQGGALGVHVQGVRDGEAPAEGGGGAALPVPHIVEEGGAHRPGRAQEAEGPLQDPVPCQLLLDVFEEALVGENL